MERAMALQLSPARIACVATSRTPRPMCRYSTATTTLRSRRRKIVTGVLGEDESISRVHIRFTPLLRERNLGKSAKDTAQPWRTCAAARTTTRARGRKIDFEWRSLKRV